MIKTKIKRASHLISTRREAISAVHDDDLADFLHSIGAYNQVADGKAKCKFCGDGITFDNIRTVFPEAGAVKFVCDKPKCFRDFLDHQSEK